MFNVSLKLYIISEVTQGSIVIAPSVCVGVSTSSKFCSHVSSIYQKLGVRLPKWGCCSACFCKKLLDGKLSCRIIERILLS